MQALSNDLLAGADAAAAFVGIGSGNWNTVGQSDVGSFVQCSTGNGFLYQDVPATGGGLYSLSASMDPDRSGDCYVKVDWLDGTGKNLGDAGPHVTADGWVRAYTADNAIQAPNSTTKARVYCIMVASPAGQGRLKDIQFQRGGLPTPFRDDSTINTNASRITAETTLRTNQAGTYASQFNSITSMFAGQTGSYLLSSITSIQQTVATNQTTISQRVDTITSSLKALSSPNLLANGGFTNGFSGWTLGNPNNWTIYTQYSPGIWAQYNGTDDCYGYTDVYGIQGNTNYCFSFAGSSDSEGDYCHMYVEWWSTNFQNYLGRQEIGPSQQFNRTNFGPYKTPSNAAIARVGMQGRNNGNNSAGGRKWRQLQLQQSDTPTAYSDASSLQGLQAQVTTQAGTLADVSNKVNGTILPRLTAFWQTQAQVGNTQAFITAQADLGNGKTTSSVAIGAQAFYVLNDDGSGNWVKAFQVSGGNTYVYGNLAVDGAVSVKNLQFGTGGLFSLWYNENTATTNTASQWQSFCQMELTPQDGQMIDGTVTFRLFSYGADTDVLFRVRRDDGTIVKGGQNGQGVKLRANAGGTPASLGWLDSVPAGRDTTWYVECIKASDTGGVGLESTYGKVEEVGRAAVQHATITTPSGQGPGAGSAGGGNINGGAGGGGGGGGFGNSNQRQF